MYKKIIYSFLILVVLMSCSGNNKEAENLCSVNLANKNVTKETKELYCFLSKLAASDSIMLGHQDALAYGHGWYKENGRSDVKRITGDYPAVVGWELGHLELGAAYNLDSVYFSDMQSYIKETYKRGGITTCSWHGDNIVTGNDAWDCGQNTVVKSILPNGENHEKYLVWLDRLAVFFNSLKDDEGKAIPVVFRPYHENTGDWFWWCAEQCTPDEYKQLWIMTFDYLTNIKNVNNLIYAYSPASLKDELYFLERYPGDEYVDVIGFDTYVHGNDAKALEEYTISMQKSLDVVTKYAQAHNKVAVIGETGMEGIPETTYFTETVYPMVTVYDIAWVLFWRNSWEGDKPNHHYLPFEGHTSAPDFKEFADKPEILLNNDLKKIK